MNRKIRKTLQTINKLRLNKDFYLFVKNYKEQILGKHKKVEDKPLPRPTTLMLELSAHCNLHCITCPREYDYGKVMNKGYMDTSLAKKIVDECLPYLKSIGLTGMGETLLAPNLPEVIEYIKEKKPSVITFISTNANIPDFMERIEKILPYVDTMQVSTDGVGEVYESIRKGATFSLLEKNIEALSKKISKTSIDIMFNMVITKRNYTSMSDVIRFAEKYGIKYVNFTYFNLASVTAIDPNYYDFFKSDSFNSVLTETKNVAKHAKGVVVTGLDFLGNPGIRKCQLLWDHFQINFDGEVPPCCAKPFSKEYSFGNVKEFSVHEVINSEKAREFRKQWFDNKPNDFCKKCHFVQL